MRSFLRKIGLALAVAGVVAGCAMSPPDVDEIPGRELTWEEFERYRRLVNEKTAEPRRVEKMKEALYLYEPMVKTRPGDVDTALGAAGTAIWLAENATESSEVRHYARKAYDYACIARKAWSWNALAHYRVALALGYYARESSSLKARAQIPEMEASCLEAIRHGETIERAGPHRFLGLLYAQAPGYPTSVGDIEKAMEHLERAIELFPDEPENHLALAEVLLDEGEEEEARVALEKAKSLFEDGAGESDSRPGARRIAEKIRDLSAELAPEAN